MLNRQEVNPYEAVEDITGEYELFCKILFIFALRYFNFEIAESGADIFRGESLCDVVYDFKKWHIAISEHNIESLEINGFVAEIYVDSPIEVKCTPITLNESVISRFSGVKIHGKDLTFEKVWEDQQREELIKALKVTWPGNKTTWPADLRMKLESAFSNANQEKRKCLMLPWKYLFPNNIEEVSQLLGIIKDKISDEYFDMIYILTASRPNELSNIEDQAILSRLLSYGKANAESGIESTKIGIVPVGLGDINSYRRYTKILLDHMIALDHDREYCPICGDGLNRGKGDQSNIFRCHTCGFEIVETQCSNCGKKYPYTRYTLPKTSTVDIENPGFRIMARENEFGFKNITDAYIEDGTIHLLCPHCGM